MPRRILMGSLVLGAQQRCDMENHGLIGTAEWKNMFSTQYGELFGCIASSGLRYFEATSDITTTGAVSYSEPSTHLGTVGVDYVESTGRRRALQRIMARERNNFAGVTGTAQAYAMIDDQIYLFPTPPAGQTYQMSYIPQPPDLATWDDDEYVDVVTPDGESFLIWGVSVQALAKQGADVSVHRAERDLAKGRLYEWAVMREFEASPSPIRADDDNWWDPGGWWNRP